MSRKFRNYLCPEEESGRGMEDLAILPYFQEQDIDRNNQETHPSPPEVFSPCIELVTTEPVNCSVDGMSLAFANSYCWRTFHTKPYLRESTIEQPDASEQKIPVEEQHFTTVTKIPLILIGHGLSFYVVRLFWVMLEGGTLKQLSADDTPAAQLLQNSRKCCVLTLLFLIMEILNIVAVSLNFSYLKGIFGYPAREMPDPILAKCFIQRYGPSGIVMKYDGICQLNSIYIYNIFTTFIMYWLVFVIVMSVLSFCYHLLFICFKGIQKVVISCDNEMFQFTNDASFGVMFYAKQLTTLSPEIYTVMRKYKMKCDNGGLELD